MFRKIRRISRLQPFCLCSDPTTVRDTRLCWRGDENVDERKEGWRSPGVMGMVIGDEEKGSGTVLPQPYGQKYNVNLGSTLNFPSPVELFVFVTKRRHENLEIYSPNAPKQKGITVSDDGLDRLQECANAWFYF